MYTKGYVEVHTYIHTYLYSRTSLVIAVCKFEMESDAQPLGLPCTVEPLSQTSEPLRVGTTIPM